MADGNRTTAIIGGGFSGAMLAARLAEEGLPSLLIDRTGNFGAGVAYSTGLDRHLLNVRANRMSAVEGRPDDFVRWLETHHPRHADPEGFVPRRLYGLYVQDRLARTEASHPGLIERLTGEAAAIEGSTVRLADGQRIEADAVVLATGNPSPRTAPGDGAGRIVVDPWAEGALDRVAAEDAVLIFGTGLTMVDVVLGLLEKGWQGRATALSRRGLLPRAHGEVHDPAVPPTPALTEGPASRRLAEGRRMAGESGWRGVMEGLRPITADLWSAADAPTRGRWLRHLRPWWDVHRHRIAPGIAATLESLQSAGRLTVGAGRVRQARETADGVEVVWTPRGGQGERRTSADWLIDCSGPGHDPATQAPMASLIEAGRARLDPLGLGLELDAAGRAIRADGSVDPRLFVLGPPARAAYWETVAVPDIRKRIEIVTAALAAPDQTSASR